MWFARILSWILKRRKDGILKRVPMMERNEVRNEKNHDKMVMY